MVSKSTEYGLFHESRRAAQLAADLVANGAPADLDLVQKVLEAVLACQELDPLDPHYGNFYWMREDSEVEDLNAVEFNLERLIPMMLCHGDRLPQGLQERVLQAIRLGLAEIERLNVLVAYTNITMLDVLNTSLGGELLASAPIARRGYAKLAEWIAFTAQSGHPLEYNSPTYTAVTLRALKKLVDLVQDAESRIRARAMAARLGVSVATHIHQGSGRWAGPHGRAYHPSILCETRPELEMLQEWIQDGTVPSWLQDLLTHGPRRFAVTESAFPRFNLSFTTYQTPTYALGTASANSNPQNNVCMLHYTRPEAAKPGVFYTRYVLDDKWFGDFYHATDRSKQRNLLEEGDFFSVQDGNRMIGLYGVKGNHFKSAKAVLIWTDRSEIREIRINGEVVTELPATVPPQATVTLASGEIYMAIRPLYRTPLGREISARLVEREGDLVLELYNYRAQIPKRFWELNWPGAFYQGRPICAYYLEVGEQEHYPDLAAFARTVTAGSWQEVMEPPFTYTGEGERPYSLSYTREGQELGLTVDLMQWQPLRRWTHTGELGWPMLTGWQENGQLFVAQAASGRVTVGDATVTSTGQGLWLCGLPTLGRWVAGHFGLEPVTLTLETPLGAITVTEMGMGTVMYDGRQAVVDAVGNPVLAGIHSR